MNGDLISKSALLEEMSKFVGNQRYLISEEVWRMVENAPTAYDVDKVVEQIECEYLMCRCKNNEICTYPETIGCCYDNGIKKAVEIMKSGGID